VTLRDSLQAAVSTAVRDVWGQPVSYTPLSTGVAEAITAILDTRWMELSGSGEATQSAQVATLQVRTDDLSVYPEQGDTLTTGGRSYRVDDVQTDNGDMPLLILGRV